MNKEDLVSKIYKLYEKMEAHREEEKQELAKILTEAATTDKEEK